MLSRRELSAVLEAYLPLPRLTWRLRMLEQIDKPSPFATAPDHVSLSRNYYKTASKMHGRMVLAIDVAIAELERNNG